MPAAPTPTPTPVEPTPTPVTPTPDPAPAHYVVPTNNTDPSFPFDDPDFNK